MGRLASKQSPTLIAFAVPFLAVIVYGLGSFVTPGLSRRRPLRYARLNAVSTQFPLPITSGSTASTTMPQQSLQSTFWRVDQGFSSTIRIKNALSVGPLHVVPVLYMADGTGDDLPAIDLPAGGTANVSVNDALANAPASLQSHVSDYGSATLLYFWRTAGVAIASMQVMNSASSLVFDFPFLPSIPGKGGKQTIEGLWWMHDPGIQTFVAASNNTSGPRSVELTASGRGTQPAQPLSITLPPHATRLLPLSSILPGLSYGPGEAGGVHVEFHGEPSDISMAGGMMNPANGFSVTMRFVIPAARGVVAGPMRLASSGVLIGKQDASMGFPASTRFLPYVVLRNTTAAALPVAIGLYTTADGSKRIPLRIPALAAFEARDVPVRQILESSGLRDYNGGITLEFSWQGRWGDLVAAVGSVDQSGTYVFEVSPTVAHQTWAKESPFWVVGNGDDTMFSLWNSGTAAEDIVATFTLGNQPGRYTIPIHLSPGETRMIDMAQLISQHEPDANGNTIPPGADEGSAMFAGASGPRQPVDLVVSSGEYNAEMGTCCEGCMCCYGVISLDVLDNPTDCGDLDTCDMNAKENMSDGTQNDVTSSASWSSGNTSIATVSSGAVQTYTAGTTDIGALVQDQQAGQVCGTLLICNFNAFSNEATLNVCDFSFGPRTQITAQICDALTDNEQQFTGYLAPGSPNSCLWSTTNSSCQAEGGQVQGDPEGTAEVFIDYGKSYSDFSSEIAAYCFVYYTAGPADANNLGGTYSVTMNMAFSNGTVSHIASGDVGCP